MQRQLTPAQRLKILRAADVERKWYSLDDQRACVVCDRMLTGWQVKICRDQRGRYLLKCPTNGCPSFVGHWFYPGNTRTAAAVLASHRQTGGDHFAVASAS
ncbi:MAG TPA: hypothetical protein VJ719_01455 [Chthoniobacterales bacterium]|nr:hypothetical protein [Chthoniobacterales bacterium]